MKKLIYGAVLWIACHCVAVLPAAAGTVNYRYDASGRLSSADYEGGIFIDYRYDFAGNLLARISGNSLVANVYPDAAVDLKDLILVLQILNSQGSQAVNLRGDVGGDGRIGSEEAIFLLQRLADLR